VLAKKKRPGLRKIAQAIGGCIDAATCEAGGKDAGASRAVQVRRRPIPRRANVLSFVD